MEIRGITIDEIPEVLETEKEAWREDPELTATEEQLRERYETHPEGYLAVFVEGEMKAFSYGITYDYDELKPQTWEEATKLEHHNPDGDTLYIVTLSVADQGKGYGKAIMEANKELGEELDTEQVVAGARPHASEFFTKCGYKPQEEIEKWWEEDKKNNGEGIIARYNV